VGGETDRNLLNLNDWEEEIDRTFSSDRLTKTGNYDQRRQTLGISRDGAGVSEEGRGVARMQVLGDFLHGGGGESAQRGEERVSGVQPIETNEALRQSKDQVNYS